MPTMSENVDTSEMVDDYESPTLHPSTRSVNSNSDSSVFPSELESSYDHEDYLPSTIRTTSKRPKCTTTFDEVPRSCFSPHDTNMSVFPPHDSPASRLLATNKSFDSCGDTGAIEIGVYGSLLEDSISISTDSIPCDTQTMMLSKKDDRPDDGSRGTIVVSGSSTRSLDDNRCCADDSASPIHLMGQGHVAASRHALHRGTWLPVESYCKN